MESLGLDVHEANRDERGPLLTLDEAQLKAEDIYDWHQETFSDYWEWIRDTIDRVAFACVISRLFMFNHQTKST